MSDYVVWSNEHRAWWGPNSAGYCTRLAGAGRYSREDALGICIGARGGRQYNENPSEVPVLYEDAALFWPDDKPEWRESRARWREKYEDDDYHKPDASGYSRADEEWFFDVDGKP